jgi:predicted nucleic acid-binding protein
MLSLVIDPSIALKCLLPEADSERALKAIEKATLQAPEWLAAECAEVLAHRVRLGELDRDKAAAALADIELLPISWVSDLQLVALPSTSPPRSAGRSRTASIWRSRSSATCSC